MSLTERFNQWRFGKWFGSSYTMDKLIFNGAIILIFVYIFLIAYSYDFDFSPRIYIKCTTNIGCENPFYIPENPDILWQDYREQLPLRYKGFECIWDWCKEKQMPYGFEFGNPPSLMFKYADWFSIGVIIFAFVLNHLLWNRDKIKFGDITE